MIAYDSENDGAILYTYEEMRAILQKYESLLTIFLLGIEQYGEGYFDLLIKQGIFEEDLPLWKWLSSRETRYEKPENLFLHLLNVYTERIFS